MSIKRNQINKKELLNGFQDLMDENDLVNLENSHLTRENEVLEETKDILIDSNSELVKKIRDLNTSASLLKVHGERRERECPYARTQRCQNCMAETCPYARTVLPCEQQPIQPQPVVQPQPAPQPVQPEQHPVGCHCSACCPNPNPNWFQRNSKSICISVLWAAMLILAIGWSPSGATFDAIQKSYVELLVNFFKMAIFAISIIVTVKLVNSDKKNK